MQVQEFFLNLLEVNEGVNYALIIALVVGYVFFTWFVVTVWVFYDARKRYEGVFFALFFSLFILPLNVPGLICYILIRPEHTLEEDYYINLALGGERELRPIYFDGDKGFDISLNLSVQPKQAEEDKHKMVMNVEWLPQRLPISRREKPSGSRVSFSKYKRMANSLVSRVASKVKTTTGQDKKSSFSKVGVSGEKKKARPEKEAQKEEPRAKKWEKVRKEVKKEVKKEAEKEDVKKESKKPVEKKKKTEAKEKKSEIGKSKKEESSKDKKK